MVEIATSTQWWNAAPTRVLVVDDPDPLSATTFVFAAALRDEGYEVQVVAGASECLERFEPPPDLVLLGTLRPGMPWTQLCRQMQAKADVPIIVAARLESEIDAVLAFELGVAGYLSDPSRTREMVARVRAALRGVSPTQSDSHIRNSVTGNRAEPLAAGALQIDMVGREVTHNGAPVYLARREFDLLSALLSPPGVVRTRRELIDSVWESRGLKGSRTLDTHVRRLRLKLEDDPTQPRMLMTVRGVGFLFDLDAIRGDRAIPR
jgi:two-component system response regulator RegX3